MSQNQTSITKFLKASSSKQIDIIGPKVQQTKSCDNEIKVSDDKPFHP